MNESTDAGKIADAYLMFLAGRTVNCIVETLDSAEWIGLDEGDDPSKPFCERERSGKRAIEQIKRLSDDIARAELLAGQVKSEDSTDLRCVLIELREEICQADVPAEMALADGFEDEAIAICRDAVVAGEVQCRSRLRMLCARCEVMADVWAGTSKAAISEALGCDMKALSTDSYLALHDVLESRKWAPKTEAQTATPPMSSVGQLSIEHFHNATKLLSVLNRTTGGSWRRLMDEAKAERDELYRREVLPVLDELRKANEADDDELTERNLPTPRTLEQWERLARIVECPLDDIRNGTLTAAEIFEHAIAWADRKRIEVAIVTGAKETIDPKPRIVPTGDVADDRLPKSKRASSPSRVKARSAYDYAIERIENAHAMTGPELHAAILEDGEAAAMVPANPETFVRYLNDGGIRLKKGESKSAGGSVVRRSDL